MKILVSGAGGLIGSELLPVLLKAGHQVVKLTRKADGPGSIQWDPQEGTIDRRALEGFDSVIHLAGESIAGKRWTPLQKAKILDSRVRGTTLLSEALAAAARPPASLLTASAIGIYGDRGDQILREDSFPGTGFLADVCRRWEAAADAVVPRGIRNVRLRTGIVLSKRGGALAKMLVPFRLGAGGRIGSGKQYMSWISIDDHIRAIVHCINAPTLQGPVNIVAPSPVTNLEFTKTLGRALSRPSVFPLPAFAARIALGEMADELLLYSARVEPAKLLADGFVYRYPSLETALKGVL